MREREGVGGEGEIFCFTFFLPGYDSNKFMELAWLY